MTSAAASGGTAGPSPGPQNSPGFLLWRATLGWQRRISTALRPFDLTHVQFVLLAAVWWLSDQADHPSQLPSQRQVAAHAAADVMMTSQVVRGLAARGLISRAPDPADGRVRRLTVTDAGRVLTEQAITVVEATDAHFFARVRQPTQLLEVLHQLADDPESPRATLA